MTITVPAAQVRQGELTLYTTSLKVKYLISDGFYSIDRLDPDNPDQGYQRVLHLARAKKLADYIVKGQESKDAFLPTSVFLATDKPIDYDRDNNTISLCLDDVGPFNVVDGQHRLEGLRIAAGKDSRVGDFEVPVNIAPNMPYLHQMCHFLIVNTTQKGVDKAIEQNIYARLTQFIDVEEIPNLPKWIKTIVQKGDVARALKIVRYMNETSDSPWHEKVQMAGATRTKLMTLKQDSFVKQVNKYILTANNPLIAINDFEKEKAIFMNYWKAIISILDFDAGSNTVLYKYNGVALFCMFSIPFFTKLQTLSSYTVSTMEEHLGKCFDNMEGDYSGIGHPDWWKRGGVAGTLNTAALRKISSQMATALNRSDDEIEI